MILFCVASVCGFLYKVSLLVWTKSQFQTIKEKEKKKKKKKRKKKLHLYIDARDCK